MILHSEETIEEYTRKGDWGERTLLDQFRENCADYPDRVALEDPPDREELAGTEPRSLTYRELERAVEATAGELLRMGLDKDDVVVAQLPNVWELAMLYLAVARAGGVLSPLPVQWGKQDVGHVVELTGARFYMGTEQFEGFDYVALARELGIENAISLEQLTRMAEAEPGSLPDIPVCGNEVFSLCWTSGTEAEPKGCPLTHNNLFFQGGLKLRVVDIREGDRILCVTPLVNMVALGVNFIPWLLVSGTLVLHHPLTPEILLRQLTEEDIQYTILVPAVLNTILEQENVDQIDLSHVRTITTGGSPPSASTMQEFKRRWGIEISNDWGQNEGTTIQAGPKDVPDFEMRVDHLPLWGKEGCAWPSGVDEVEIKLLDLEDREVTEPGEVGELCYRGPNVFPGYFERPDLTEESFTPDGYFRTGDQFVLHDACHVGFYDRKKDIVIRGGFNVSSAEVENAVQGYSKVSEAAVVPVPDEKLGERVCVFVAPRDSEEPPELEEITSYLSEQGMSVYKLPERLKVVSELPRNPAGKVLKRELEERVKDAGDE